MKLRSDVFPAKKEIIDTTNNLDLNTTARRNDKTLDKFCPYMMNSTYCVLEAKLANPIGSFKEEHETQKDEDESKDLRPTTRESAA